MVKFRLPRAREVAEAAIITTAVTMAAKTAINIGQLRIFLF